MPLLASRRRRRHRVPYNEAVMSDAPLAYWRLDDASGNFLDSAPNGRAATPAGTITRAVAGALTGDVDTAATFATSSGYAAVADFDTTANYTIEAWVKAGTQNSSLRHIVNRDSLTAGQRIFQFGIIATDGSPTAQRGFVRAVVFNTTGANIVAYGPVRVDNNAWHHVMLVVSGGTATVWVGGVAGTPVSIAGTVKSSGGVFGLAQMSGQAGGIHGGVTLDEVAIYGYALTSGRILAHYNSGRGQ